MSNGLYDGAAIATPEWWAENALRYPASLTGRVFNGYIRLITTCMGLLPRTDLDDPSLDWGKVRYIYEKAEGFISVFFRAPPREPARGCPVPGAWFAPDPVVVAPSEGASGRTILYVHGGSYCLDRTKLHDRLAANLADHAQARVLAVDYRLAPEHPFPDAIEDVVSSYQWLLAEGLLAKDVAIVGDSAGAGIALAALIAMRDQDIPMPAAYVALCPWADLTFSGASIIENAKADPFMSDIEFVSMFAKTYRQSTPADHPLVSPALADLTGMPDTLVHAGGSDMLLDDAKSIVKGVRHAGGRARLDVWEHMPHVWQKLAGAVPDSRASLVMIGHFLRQQIPTSRSDWAA